MELILQKNIGLVLFAQKIAALLSKTITVLHALIRIGKGDTKIGRTYVVGSPQNCPTY